MQSLLLTPIRGSALLWLDGAADTLVVNRTELLIEPVSFRLIDQVFFRPALFTPMPPARWYEM